MSEAKSMSTSNEVAVMRLALEALEDLGMKHFESTGEVLHKEVFDVLKEALAEQEQSAKHVGEPVAWELGAEVYWGNSPEMSDYVRKEGTPLYTTPQQRTAAEGEDTRTAWVGLTDDERGVCINSNFGTGLWLMAKDIEAKLKEKNNVSQ